MFERYDPSKKPVKTIGFDGEIYDSGLEARFANTLDMRGIPYIHNGIAIFAEILGGQYKPDFVWDRKDGGKIVAEVKGWQSERAKAAADAIRDYCDEETSPIAEFVYAWSKGITLYKDGRERAAAFHTCNECGETSVAWLDDPECTHCGSHDLEYLCEDFNSWANKEWEKQWSQTWQRYIEKDDYENQVQRYLKAFAGRHTPSESRLGIDLNEGGLRLFSQNIYPGQWTPDFYYTEQPANRSQYGTALAPIAVIQIAEMPTNAERRAYSEVLQHVADPLSPIVKFIEISRDGIQVADYYTQAQPEAGRWYECNRCGKVFAASDNYTKCPCCDSQDTHSIKGKE